MTLPVFHIGDQVFAYQFSSRIPFREHLLQGVQNDVDDLDILLFIVSADIVSLKETALFLHHVDALRVILHVQPVPNIFPVAVYRKLLALKRIVDNQRNQLFRELVRAVIVAAVRNIRREPVSIHIGLYQHVRRSLACGIRAVRIIGRGLIEICVLILQRTVDFIG